MKLIGAGLSHVGKKRKTNEDSFHVDWEKGLFVVADGMGGHVAGEVASRLAVETIQQFLAVTDADSEITWPSEFDANLSSGGNRIKAAIQLANREIVKQIQERQDYRGMGTTVVTAVIIDHRCFLGHVGDSRAYLIRTGEISLLTRDHTFVNEQVEKGFMTHEEAQRHPARNILTRAVGSTEEIDVELGETPLQKGDLVLLCSDGLSSMMNDEEILKTVMEHPKDPEIASKSLVALANDKGGLDNVTVVLIQAVE